MKVEIAQIIESFPSRLVSKPKLKKIVWPAINLYLGNKGTKKHKSRFNEGKNCPEDSKFQVLLAVSWQTSNTIYSSKQMSKKPVHIIV